MATQISATIVADSKNTFGNRLTSMEVVFPRFILAELNTHRLFSRNSASSRAIPFEKMLKMIQEDPFIPIAWMKDHKGMQGNEFFPHFSETKDYNNDINYGFWMDARDNAIIYAKSLSDSGLTKQIVNRLLEPFMWHKVLITASEWENFFALRYESAAEIHMQELAKCMLEVMNNNTPKQLQEGEWHIPYGESIWGEDLKKGFHQLYPNRHYSDFSVEEINNITIKISTAKCAGVSYTLVGEDGKVEDYNKLIARHDKLLQFGHMSPTEHCAKAMTELEYYSHIKGSITTGKDKTGIFNHEQYCTGEFSNKQDYYGWCHNFRGFKSYRSTIQGESKNDIRLIKK